MKTTEFIATLMPSFERTRLVSLVADTRTQVNENLLPVYRNAVEALQGKPYASQPGKALGAFMAHHVHMRYSTNPLQGILQTLEGIPQRLDTIEAMIHKTFGKDVVRDALTYRESTLLQYLNALTFVVEFAGPLLDRVTAAEVAVQNKRPQDVDRQLKPAQIKYLTEQMDHFAEAMTIAMKPIDEIVRDIESVPDITVVAGNEEIVHATVGADKLDPLKFGFFGLRTNPAYFIGKWWADHQVANYQRATDERKTIELRLLALRDAYNGKQDPRIEQQINYNEERLAELTRKVRKMEERWS